MSHKIIDGKKQAQIVKDEVHGRVSLLKELGWQPRLISMDVGDSPAVSLYIKNQQRACALVGIEFEHHHYPGNITQREILAAIYTLNADPRVQASFCNVRCRAPWTWRSWKTPFITSRMWRA
jgi:methylenetetrahydrofolate dehydrogenase (NADP+) / methenyltetrahydrofolate cyclohydrolase